MGTMNTLGLVIIFQSNHFHINWTFTLFSSASKSVTFQRIYQKVSLQNMNIKWTFKSIN